MTTTTELGGWSRYTRRDRPEDVVIDYLGDFASTSDVTAITAAWRAEINALLAGTGIELHGSEWYGAYPAREDAEALIQQAIEDSSLDSAIASIEGD